MELPKPQALAALAASDIVRVESNLSGPANGPVIGIRREVDLHGSGATEAPLPVAHPWVALVRVGPSEGLTDR